MTIAAPGNDGTTKRKTRRRTLLRRIAFVRRNRCSGLLAVLCLLILLSPIFSPTALGGVSLMLGLVGALVVALWALHVRRVPLIAAAFLGFITVDALALHRFGSFAVGNVALMAMTAFMVLVTMALLKYVLDWHVITIDKVFGAVSVYVLIAFTFASLFALLQIFEPTAFVVDADHEPDGHLAWVDMMYFSFTVLTSTGFGEITPRTGMARSLIIIEQIFGVMYVAFLVARLANLYGLHARSPSRDR